MRRFKGSSAAAGLAVLFLTAILGHVVADDSAPGAAKRVEYNRDIRPILSDHCFACHGPDKNKREADLRLDLREEAQAMGAIAPGNHEESELYWRVISDEPTEVMPPPGSHKPLNASQKELLTRWLEQGAEYQPHWAYVKPTRPAVPQVKGRVENPIDAFVLATLEKQGIPPAEEADRRTLARRLYLDLTGLPPSEEEVAAFVNDDSSRAYEAVVDQLLDSPRYGERMAVPWLDVVRYADTVGFHGDQYQNTWPYREWVIRAFNENMPFDRFTRDQLAGDLLPDATPEQRLATCFNRLNMVTREGGAQPGEYLAKYTADRVRTVGMAWLGSTLACAECHDHKFDPFSTRDFYSLGAFFADVKQWGVYSDYTYTPNPDLKGWTNDHPFPPEITVESPYLKQRITRLENRIREVVEVAADKMGEPGPATSAFEQWRDELLSLLEQEPTGWKAPSPVVEMKAITAKEAKVKEAEEIAALVVEPGSAILFPTDKATNDTIRLTPGAGWVAAVRIELLPQERHGGSILRTGETSTIKVGLQREAAESDKAEELKVRIALADRAQPQYDGGLEILGVENGWLTAKDASHEAHSAVWILERPVRFADQDVLVVSMPGNGAGSAKVTVSPLVPRDPKAPGISQELAAALREEAKAAVHNPVVQAVYLCGTAWDAAAYDQVAAFDAEIRDCRDGLTPVLVVQSTRPMISRVLPRGNWQDETGAVVEPAVPHFLPQPGSMSAASEPLTRLDLASWLMGEENPLTARVFVNRLWRQFLGSGLSASVDDLGSQGESPSHPELLDWLAVEFREKGWDVKRLVKLIVMSTTYRQSSSPTPELLDRDPGNRLLARQSARRLEAEFVRDNALAISGLIVHDLGGPSCFPYQPEGYYANLQFPDRVYQASQGDLQYRRGLYMHWQRTFLHPMLANFDAPSREDCVAARTQANSPQQALTLLNDPSFVEAARAFAARLLDEDANSDEARIDRAFRIALARPAREREVASLIEFLASQRQTYRANPEDARKLLHVGFISQPKVDQADPAESAAWTSLCRVILNLHETITKY